MYRFLVTPRWLGINLLTLLAIPVCVWLGCWQLGRFEDRATPQREGGQRPAAAAVPLGTVLGEGPAASQGVASSDIGRNVYVTGSYNTGRQLLVPDRVLEGRRGYYVLTPLRTSSGRVLPVVRGWLPGNATAGEIPPPPAGQVTVTGLLRASENSDTVDMDATGGLPGGQIGMVSAASLVNVWPYRLYDGWITLTRTQPPLAPVPFAADSSGGLDSRAFQNLGYTGQWFVFAGFVAFMWYRLFRHEVQLQRDLALGLVTSPADPPPPSVLASLSPSSPSPPPAPSLPPASLPPLRPSR